MPLEQCPCMTAFCPHVTTNCKREEDGLECHYVKATKGAEDAAEAYSNFAASFSEYLKFQSSETMSKEARGSMLKLQDDIERLRKLYQK